MNKRIFYVFLVFLLAMSFICAETDEEYYHGTIGVDVGSGNIVITPGTCQENWGSSGWGECANGQQTFICSDSNMCGTYALMPSSCGQTQACGGTTSSGGGGGGSGGGGGGGGGGSVVVKTNVSSSSSGSGSCTESWQCSDWSNKEGECGKRECTDKNKCGTEALRPEIEKKCSFTGFFGLTGAVTGVTDFAKTTGGMITFLGLLFVIALTVVFFSIKNKKKGKKPKEEKKEE